MISLVALRLSESYFRHPWLYLLPMVLMTVVAAVYPMTVDTNYIASGNVYIQRQTLLSSLSSLGNNNFGWITPAQATEAELNELFRTDAFMIAVVQQTDLGSELSEDPAARNELLNNVRSSIWSYPQGNSLLNVAASHADPRIAQQLATAIVDTYLQWKINLGLEGSMSAQDFFVGLVSGYQSELEPVQRELTDYLTTHPEPLRGERPPSEVAEIARLQAKKDQALERLRAAESKEENARLATVQTESDVRQTYFTVDEPTIPIESTRSLRKLAIAIVACVAAGIVLSCMAIIGGALIDNTYRFAVDVQNGLSLPVLAMVPVTKADLVPGSRTAPLAGTGSNHTPASGQPSPNASQRPRSGQAVAGSVPVTRPSRQLSAKQEHSHSGHGPSPVVVPSHQQSAEIDEAQQ